MTNEIKVSERKEFFEQMGFKFAKGFTEAWKGDTKGVVNEAGEFFPTVPLNGWRARNLAEEVFGKREAGMWEIDTAIVTDAKTLQELPDFDGGNQAIVNSFEGGVIIHVVVVDPGYGQHIRIIQA